MNCGLRHCLAYNIMWHVYYLQISRCKKERSIESDLSFSRGTFYVSVDRVLFGVGELIGFVTMYYLQVDIGEIWSLSVAMRFDVVSTAPYFLSLFSLSFQVILFVSLLLNTNPVCCKCVCISSRLEVSVVEFHRSRFVQIIFMGQCSVVMSARLCGVRVYICGYFCATLAKGMALP